MKKGSISCGNVVASYAADAGFKKMVQYHSSSPGEFDEIFDNTTGFFRARLVRYSIYFCSFFQRVIAFLLINL